MIRSRQPRIGFTQEANEQQADGSFHIKALTRSGTAVNAALTALYGAQVKAAA